MGEKNMSTWGSWEVKSNITISNKDSQPRPGEGLIQVSLSISYTGISGICIWRGGVYKIAYGVCNMGEKLSNVRKGIEYETTMVLLSELMSNNIVDS